MHSKKLLMGLVGAALAAADQVVAAQPGVPVAGGPQACVRGRGAQAPWHFLNFLPEPHQQGSLRPSCSCSSTRRCSTAVPPGEGAG